MLNLMWITNSPDEAAVALDAGVDRIFVDLERLGKESRQANTSSHLAHHLPKDVLNMRSEIPDAQILVRVNPLHKDSGQEIETVLVGNPDIIMLPMFDTVEQVCQFENLVDGRAKISLLVETPRSISRLPDILEKSTAIDEIHIGLNDLHLAMGLDFIFEPLAGGVVEMAAKITSEYGVRFGFGGIARIGEGQVPAELILSEHVRLGSQMVILSRAFRGGAQYGHKLELTMDLPGEIKKVRDWESELRRMDEQTLIENSKQLRKLIFEEARRRQ